MTKASDNDYPSVLFTEQSSAPSNPAASHQRLYVRTSDHALVLVNSSGTVSAVGGGGGSAVANVGRAVYSSTDKTTTSTSFVDVDASLSVTLTTGARRCRISVSAVGKNSTNQQTCLDIDLDGSRLGGTFGLSFAGNNDNSSLSFDWVTDVLSAASHTFKLQWRVDGGTGTLYGAAGTAPIQIAVEELQA